MGSFYVRSNGEPKWVNITLTVTSALGLLFAIVLAGHSFGWWLVADSTNRQAQINQHSYGYQQSRQADLTGLITTVATINTQIPGAGDDAPALKAQRFAVVGQACAAAAQIDQPQADQAAWVAVNCTDGAANPAGPNGTTPATTGA